MTDSQLLAGQQQLVDEILAAATPPGDGVVFELKGPRGSGRTVLLAALAERFAREPACTTLRADLADYVRTPLTEAGDTPPKVALGEYETFLRDLANQVPEVREGFHERIGRPTSSARDETVDVLVRADDLAIALTEALEAKLAGRRLVLLVDNVLAASGDVARWLRRLLDRLVLHSEAMAVLTMQATFDDEPEWPGRVVRRSIPVFTAADIADYLAARSGARPSDAVVTAIARWSGGYPLAVRAAATMAGSAPEVEELAPLLERPPSDVVASMTAALEFLRDADDAVRATIEVAAVLRTFDVDAVLAVLGRLGVAAPDDVGVLLRRLPLTRPAGREDSYAFHEFFRVLVERDLEVKRRSEADETRFVAITKAAIGYYQDRLRDSDDREAVYAAWKKRLEPPEMQALMLEFLHHAARFTDRTWARRRFASVYFDIYWWWGAYVESPLTTQLVDGWESSQRRYDESEFLGQFRRFQRSYVPAAQVWREGAGSPERWADAVDALKQIRGPLLKLRAPSADAGHRHVLAITASFMGDAFRHQDLHDPQADERYREALEAFRANAAQAREQADRGGRANRVEDDAWCIPWAQYLLADLASARGQHAEATRVAHEALEAATDPSLREEDRDYEIIADLHRVLGDALLDAHPVAAFDEYVRAVFASYAFQAARFPDQYTREFHREQTGRAIERLRTLARTREQDALEVCRAVAAWGLSGLPASDPGDLLRRRSWDDLASVLFPREPRVDEFGRETEYVQRVRRVRQELAPELLRSPPAEPAKPALGGIWRRLRPKREAVQEQRPRAARSFPPLPDVAVGSDRFAPPDDPAWPSWWRDELVPVDWEAVPANQPLPGDLQAALEHAISDLPPRRRQVLELRDVEGRSAAEVCEELDISEADQTVMLHRARSALRRALESQLAEAARQ